MLAEPDVDRAVVAAATRPIAALLERCAEFLGMDVSTVREAAAHVEPYVRVDGTGVWSLMPLERRLRPGAYGRVRGGYIAGAGPYPMMTRARCGPAWSCCRPGGWSRRRPPTARSSPSWVDGGRYAYEPWPPMEAGRRPPLAPH